MSVRLYVGNLPKEPIDRKELQAVFADAGESVSTKVIKDRKTGKCRGFAFVTVPTDEMADVLIEKYNGQSFMDNPLKIEKALPRAKGKSKEETQSQPGSESETAPVVVTSAPIPAAERASTSTKRQSGGGGKKRSRPQNQSGSAIDSDSIQPDPRWAGELAKLKEMLAAQASNS
jgi:RNA recognition motif-containing protein